MFKKIKKWVKTDEGDSSGLSSKDKSRSSHGHKGSNPHHHHNRGHDGQPVDRTNSFVSGEPAYSHAVCADGTVDYTAFQLCSYDPVLRVAAFVGDNEDGIVVGCSNAQTKLPLRRGVHWIACQFVCGTTHLLVMSPETLFCYDYSSVSSGGSGDNYKASSALFYSGAGTQFTSLHVMQGVLGGVIGRRDGVLSFFKLVSTTAASPSEQSPSFSLSWASYQVNITASLASVKSSSAPSSSSSSSPMSPQQQQEDNSITWIDSIPSNPNAVLCVSRRWGGACKWYISEDRVSRFYEAVGKDGNQCAVKACTATANGQSIVAVSADLCSLFVWSSEKDQKQDRRVAPHWVIGLARFCGSNADDSSSLQAAPPPRDEYFSFWSARSNENARQNPTNSVVMAGGNIWLNMVLDMENHVVVSVDDAYSTYLDGKDPKQGEASNSKTNASPTTDSAPREEEKEVGSPEDLENQLHRYSGDATSATGARASAGVGSDEESDEDDRLGYILAVVPCWKDYWKTQWQVGGECDPHVMVIVADCGPFLCSPWIPRNGGSASSLPFTPLPLSECTFYDNSVNRGSQLYYSSSSSVDGLLPSPPRMSIIQLGTRESKMIRDPNAAARQQALDAGRVPVGGWDNVLRGGSAVLDGDCAPSPFVQFGLLGVGQRTHLRVCFDTGDASQAPQSTDRSTFSPASCGANVFMVEWLKGGFVSSNLSDDTCGGNSQKSDAASDTQGLRERGESYTLVWRQTLSFYSDSMVPLTESNAVCGRTVAELYSSHSTLMLGIVDVATRQVHRRVLVTRNEIFKTTEGGIATGTGNTQGNSVASSVSDELPRLARSACLVGVRSSRPDPSEQEEEDGGVNAHGRPQDTAAMLSRIGNGACQLSSTGNALLVELEDSSVVLLSLTGGGMWSQDYGVGSSRAITASPFIHIPRALFPASSTISSMTVAWSTLPIVMTVPRSVAEDTKRAASGAKQQQQQQKNSPAEAGSDVVKVTMKTLLAVCGLKENKGVIVFDLCRSQPVAYHRDVPTPLYTFCVNGALPPRPPSFLSQTGKVTVEIPTFVTPDVNTVGIITFRDVTGAILMNLNITRVLSAAVESHPEDSSAPAQWAWRVDTSTTHDDWVRIEDPSASDGTQPRPRLRFMFDQSTEELEVAWVFPDSSSSSGCGVVAGSSAHQVPGVADALPLYSVCLGNAWPLAEPFYYQSQPSSSSVGGGGGGDTGPKFKKHVIPTDSETALWRASPGGQPLPSAASASSSPPPGVLFVHSTTVSFWPCSKLLVSTFTSQTGARDAGAAPASPPANQNPSCALPNGFTVEAAELLSPEEVRSNILTGGLLVILCKNINRWRRLYFLDPVTLTPVGKPFQTLRYASVDAVSLKIAHIDSLTHVYLFGVVDRDRLSALPPSPLLSHVVLGPISALATEQGPGAAPRSEDALRWRSMPEGLRTRRPFEHCDGAIATPLPNSTAYCSMLPAMPTGKEEKGFFKRLVTISLDEAVKQVDGMLAEERRESFDDFQKRVVEPFVPQMTAPTSTSTSTTITSGQGNPALTDRERLLGKAGGTSAASSRYEAIKEKAALEGISLNEARRTMNENLEKLHERGERINKIQLKSQELADEASTFQDLARQLKEKQRNSWL